MTPLRAHHWQFEIQTIHLICNNKAANKTSWWWTSKRNQRSIKKIKVTENKNLQHPWSQTANWLRWETWTNIMHKSNDPDQPTPIDPILVHCLGFSWINRTGWTEQAITVEPTHCEHTIDNDTNYNKTNTQSHVTETKWDQINHERPITRSHLNKQNEIKINHQRPTSLSSKLSMPQSWAPSKVWSTTMNTLIN